MPAHSQTPAPSAPSRSRADNRLPPALGGRLARGAVKIGGQTVHVSELSAHQITGLAERILSTDRSFLRSVLLEQLYQFGVLSSGSLFDLVREQVAISDQLSSFTRQLNRYQQAGLVLPVSRNLLHKALRAGLPDSSQVWCLGPVGEEYARRKGWSGDAPLQPIPTEEHLTHDLLCAEALLRMRAAWPRRKKSLGVAEVRGPRAVAMWDIEKKAFAYRPTG